MSPKALVLTGDGINCEEETAFAFQSVGIEAEIWHVNRLIETPHQLKEYQVLALPGGFSFGDEVNSGKVLALKLKHQLGETLTEYIQGDHLVIGICNGFQALVKLGVLPVSDLNHQQVTLAHNRQKRFINRWVSLTAPQKTLFFEGLTDFWLPIRHGEGRLMVPQGKETEFKTSLQPHIAAVYDEDVNGSFLRTAALVNTKGNILGLMPHPEAFMRWTHCPAWTALSNEEKAGPTAGQIIFQNMAKALRN